MKVTAFELTGAQLDYWVAVAMGTPKGEIEIHQNQCVILEGDSDVEYSFEPSSNGSDGVPIIEREGIGTAKYHEAIDGPIDDIGLQWAAMSVDDTVFARGTTMLEAAMRVFVASKLGETFDDGEAE